MKRAAVRLLLLILFVAGSAGAGYFIWQADTQMRSSAGAAGRFDDGAAAAARAALDLRAAQQAYVAAGQGEPFWIDKVSTVLSDLKASIAGLQAHAVAAQAQTALARTRSVLDDFEQIDGRAREYARSDQRLIASDLIFSDGLELTGAVIASLDEARYAERSAHGAVAARTRRDQLTAAGAWAAFAFLLLCVPLPSRRPKTPAAQPPAVATEPSMPDAEPADEIDFAIKLDREAQKWAAAQAPESRPADLDLDAVASVCTQLARVVDTRALPTVLERTAGVLNASGIVLWIADPDARELTPIVSYGYPAQIVTRLGTIPREAQNVTASAFRTGLVQTVNADAVSSGAIAAPLVTPGGVVGVMAAEVRANGEKESTKLAAATIVAAQLATLVGPPSYRWPAKSDAAGA
jgi:hypothetical protein